MKTKVHRQWIDAEHAVQRGDLDAGFRKFLRAGDEARRDELWRLAARCYRDALELDLVSRVAVGRLVKLGAQARHAAVWIEYARALKHNPSWSQFSCRRAQILVHNLGSVVQCADVGPVLELMIGADGLFECLPDGRFSEMPLAMTMIIVRRALWPDGRKAGTARARIGYRGEIVWLDARGEWSAA